MLNNEQDILIAKFLCGEATPAEAMDLEDWADLSPANRSYLDSCARLFDLQTEADAVEGRPGDWENIETAILKKEMPQKRINRRWIGIAASLLIIISIGLLVEGLFKSKSNQVIYQTGLSAEKITLKDSSEILLFPHSSVAFHKGSGTKDRKILLTGSANFSVVHDASREFIVDMNHFYLRDIGTRFRILSSATADTILIRVIAGEIAMYDDFGSFAHAIAGETWTYIRTGKKLQALETRKIKDSARQKSAPIDSGSLKQGTDGKIPDTVIKLADTSIGLKRDSSMDYLYYSYPKSYPPDRGYTAQERSERRIKDSIESKRITDDLVREGLIVEGAHLFFELNDTAFILNGRRQSDAIFQKYKRKYAPATIGKGGAGWSWRHYSNAPANH